MKSAHIYGRTYTSSIDSLHFIPTVSQLPQQNLDESVLLRFAQWELATLRRVCPESVVVGETDNLGTTQTMVNEVDEIDEDIATAQDL
jgi:hypothetical protein